MYSAVYVLLLELCALIYRFCLLCLHNLSRSGSGPGTASHCPDKRNGVWCNQSCSGTYHQAINSDILSLLPPLMKAEVPF